MFCLNCKMYNGSAISNTWLADLGTIASTDSSGITTVFKTNGAISLHKESVRSIFNHKIVIFRVPDAGIVEAAITGHQRIVPRATVTNLKTCD